MTTILQGQLDLQCRHLLRRIDPGETICRCAESPVAHRHGVCVYCGDRRAYAAYPPISEAARRYARMGASNAKATPEGAANA